MAVLGPVFAVLGGALFLVAEDAVDEEDDQEEEVEQRPDVVAPTGRQAPSEGGHQLEDVVEMPRHSPAAGQEQLGRFISQLIAHCQTARRSAPNWHTAHLHQSRLVCKLKFHRQSPPPASPLSTILSWILLRILLKHFFKKHSIKILEGFSEALNGFFHDGDSSRIRPGYFQDFSRIFPGFFQDFSKIFPRFYQDSWGILGWGLKSILPGFFQDFSRIFPGFFQDFSKIFPRFYQDSWGIFEGLSQALNRFFDNKYLIEFFQNSLRP